VFQISVEEESREISHSKWLIALSLLLIFSFILAACKPEIIVETVEVVIEKTVEVEVLITPTPEPIPQGGSIVESTFDDAQILNPILSSDSSSSDVHTKLFLALLRLDEFSGEVVSEIADSWTVSEDGLTYTFKLRDDIFWTDGTPVTANDVKFTYDAIGSELVDTPRKSNIELVDSFNVIDDYTLEIVFHTLDCTALQNFTLGILPAHMYAEDFSDIMENPLNTEPTVTNGPFKFQEWVKDTNITLVRNEDYYLGSPNLDGWIYRVFADTSAELTAFLAGEIDLLSVEPQYVSVIEGEIAKGQPFAMKKFFNDGYSFVGFNMASPENPQMGWVDADESGEFEEGEAPNLEQEPHPILGDVLVRKAISYSLDYTNIINRVVFGQGAPIVANVLPTIEWAYNDELEPYALDTEMAAQLLDEAGWVLPEGGTVRMKDGQPLALSIMTNAGNETRENIAAIMKDTLDAMGFDITLDILDWGTVVENLLDQQFDMVIIGWIGKGSDPDDTEFWAYRYDDPGGGSNFISYYNEEVESKVGEARALPGCLTEGRGELYKDIQALIHEDAPYAFLFNPLGNVIWNTRLQAINPGPWSTYYNVEEWYLTP
jgi:peptide/nickel transport system substrate-binding protein